MQTYTTGPWEWNDRGQLIAVAVIGSTDEDALPVVIVETDGGHYAPFGADRDLIAAAPELLAALIALTTNPHISLKDRVHDADGWYGPSVIEWGNIVEAARAAIDKATGVTL